MGLVLTRKLGQKIIINGNITLEVVGVGQNIKLCFDFPGTSSVIREEVLIRARKEGNEAELYLKGLIK